MIEKSATWVVTKVRDEYGITVTCDSNSVSFTLGNQPVCLRHERARSLAKAIIDACDEYDDEAGRWHRDA